MINKISSNVFQLYFRQFGSCAYLIKLENKNILIDTSSEINKQHLINDLKELNLQPNEINTIILTHSHYDHTENLDLFTKAEIYDNANIEKLNIQDFKIIKTPGHTKDSLCVLYKNILFSGDTIFDKNRYGRTDLPGGSKEKLQESLNKLKNLNYKTLAPGHI